MMLAPWKVAPGSRVGEFMLAQRDAPVEGSGTGASRVASCDGFGATYLMRRTAKG